MKKDNKYILSFYYRTFDAKLGRPKWWQFWKSSWVIKYSSWERRVATLDEKPSEEVIQGIQLALRIVGDDIWGLQLEQSPGVYVPASAAVRTEVTTTNYIRNSEQSGGPHES